MRLCHGELPANLVVVILICPLFQNESINIIAKGVNRNYAATGAPALIPHRALTIPAVFPVWGSSSLHGKRHARRLLLSKPQLEGGFPHLRAQCSLLCRV